MKSEWKDFRLAEVGQIITGKTPSTRQPENFGGDVPFITPSDMDDRKIIFHTERYLTEAGAKSVAGAVIPARTIIVSCIGSDMGKAAIVGRRSVTNQQINSIIVDEGRFDPEFIYYNLSRRKEEIRSYAGGSAQPILNKSGFSEISVSCPFIEEQREIVEVLRALDDKIELNRQINATLEQMAQTLFKSWFVDFDPVRAKAAGRAPEGMDADTAALFPSDFEESELGLIPRGWRQGKLGEVCFNHREGVRPGEVEPNTPYIGLEHMPRKCIALDDWAYAAEAESGKSSFRTGDILFGKLRPYFHKVGVAPIDGVCSTDILVIRPTAQEFFGVALGHLSSVEVINYADKLSNGAKMPRTKWEDLAAYQIAISSTDVAASLSVAALAAVERIRGNIAESRMLAELRDALLPRLISGQLRIPEAVKLAEAVV